jgi:tetratricopeptide (TPR) repeat protein
MRPFRRNRKSDDFRVTLTQSALARAAGKPQRSLDLLNGLIERHGAQENMRFLYHRGWTLTDLARFDEAIADFTNGIRSQPDYPYAYIRRACAYGRIGRLDYAIADLETATGLIRDVYGTKDPNVRADLQRATAIAATLKAMGSANAPTSIACEGYSGEVPKPRPKSPLLKSAT